LLAWPDDPDARESRRRVAVAALVAAGSAARGRFGLEEASRFADRAHSLAALDEEHLEILALRADVAHAAVRVSDAWSLYLEALALAERLGDRARGARLAANATLLWSRYFGAFPDTEWHEAAAEMVRTWLDRLGESSESFETGALLVGRSMFEFDQIQARAGEEAIADAERALAVADRIGSPRLLSYAVDAVTMLMAVDGLCSAANAGRLAAGTRARVPDRWSAHEMLINAAHLHAAAGELDRAMELATEAAHEAATLSTHQRIHAAAAQAYTLAQAGRLAELREATAAVPDLIEEEDRTACYHGLVALAAQVLAAHELGDADAAARTLTLTDEVTSAGPDPLGERLRALELVLRVRGVEESGRLLASHPSPFGRTASMRRLRAALQIAALAGDTATVDELAPEGVALATAACAPALASIADWAASLAAGDLPGAERAALGLVGERYLSARLLADLVGFAPRVERGRLAEEAASRLEALGAVTSAGEVRTLASAVS
jgi:hypothetical protein